MKTVRALLTHFAAESSPVEILSPRGQLHSKVSGFECESGTHNLLFYQHHAAVSDTSQLAMLFLHPDLVRNIMGVTVA